MKIAVDGGLTSAYTAVEIVKSTYQSFLPDDSCESIYNNNIDSHKWFRLTKESIVKWTSYTGSSCISIYHNHTEARTKSGYYQITSRPIL